MIYAKYLISIIFFTSTSWVLGCLGHLSLSFFMRHDENVFPIGWYCEQHPYQYIFIVAVSYGIVATFWLYRYAHLRGTKRFISIHGVIVASILLASLPGGVLAGIHSIQAGFVPPLDRMIKDLIKFGTAGLLLGWLVILISIPYNILGCFIGYHLTDYGQIFLSRVLSIGTFNHKT